MSTRSRVIERLRPDALPAAEAESRPARAESEFAAKVTPLAAYVSSAVLIGTGYHLWQDVEANLHVIALWSSLACYIFGFALACYASLSSVGASRKENAAIAGLLFAFAVYAINFTLFRITSYGTDAMLFNAYSAELVTHGSDPYNVTMEPAFGLFDVPKNLVTPTATGDAIFSQSYPALSFLIYVPFALLGISAIWVSILAHLALIGILVWAAPRPLKALAPLILFADRSYAEYTLGSVTDIIWAVPVALCARYWRSKPVLAAVFLGVACAIKQSPWFIVPFAVVAWAFSAWERKRFRRFYEPLSAMLLAFLIPNAPFIFIDPQSWLRGVLTPMAGNLIAFGSGIVQLTTANVYATDLRTLTIISASALGLLLVAYAVDRRRLGFLPFIAPAIALFFAARSLQNYFMFWPAALIVYHFSPPEDLRAVIRGESRFRFPAAPVAVTALAIVLIGFLIVRGATAPVATLHVSVLKYGYDSATNNINTFDVRVTNGDAHNARDVRFGVLLQGNGSQFTYWVRTPEIIGPHQERELRIAAPSVEAEVQPGLSTVQVVALDAASGVQAYSEPQAISPPAAGLANPRLTSWQTGPPSTPVGWNYSALDFKSGFVRRARDGNGSILAFTVPPPVQDEWRVASVNQQLSGTIHRFSVRLRPYSNYVGNAYPRTIFGVEIIDPIGHHAYFTIDASLLHPEVFRHDQFTVFDLPGRLRDWNTIDIDPDQLIKTAGFILSQTTQVQINIVAAQHRGEPGTVRGDFGGIGND
jgi:uncharacterized membrane protein